MTKPLSVVFLALMLVLSLAGCQSSEPVDSVPEIVVPAPAPVTEAPAPAPVVEEEPAAAAPVTGSLTVYDYTATYEAVPGQAVVSYPDFITDEEIGAFFAYAYANHEAELTGVYYEITAPGTLVLTFPQEVTVADAAAVVDHLSANDLPAFLNQYLGA